MQTTSTTPCNTATGFGQNNTTAPINVSANNSTMSAIHDTWAFSQVSNNSNYGNAGISVGEAGEANRNVLGETVPNNSFTGHNSNPTYGYTRNPAGEAAVSNEAFTDSDSFPPERCGDHHPIIIEPFEDDHYPVDNFPNDFDSTNPKPKLIGAAAPPSEAARDAKEITKEEVQKMCEAAFPGKNKGKAGYNPSKAVELLSIIFNIKDKKLRRTFMMIVENFAKLRGCKTNFDRDYKYFIEARKEEQIDASSNQVIDISNTPLEHAEIIRKFKCPYGYTMNDDGISLITTSSEGDVEYVKICSQPILFVKRLSCIESGKENVVMLYKHGRNWKERVVEKETISTARLLTSLSAYGLDVSSDNAKQLIRFFQRMYNENIEGIPVLETVTHLGWVGDQFIPYSDQYKCDVQGDLINIVDKMQPHGDYKIWKDHIKELRKDPRMRLFMAASFAAPLLQKIGALSFFVCLYGRTGSGKTVALQVAASIWGYGGCADNPFFSTLNATRFALTERAAFLHNLPVMLDELQTISNKSSINDLIMNMAEGIGRSLGKPTGGLRAHKSWRTVFLINGEDSPIMSNSDGGAVNRVINIDADDNLVANGGYTSDLVTENYGFAGRDFIDFLQTKNFSAIKSHRLKFKDELMANSDATEKQCDAMSLLMEADAAASYVLYGSDEPKLTVEDVKPFMATKKEVDKSGRAYTFICGFVAKNNRNFIDCDDHHPDINTDIYGKRDGDFVWIIYNVLEKALSEAGFSIKTVIKQLSKTERIIKNSQGRNIHSTTVGGIKCECVKVSLNDFENDSAKVDSEEDAAGIDEWDRITGHFNANDTSDFSNANDTSELCY